MGGRMTPELERLEHEIFKHRRVRRIGLIREAWAAYMKTLEPKEPWWKRWLRRQEK
uniref:Uncharacterized protein n=2 Tax=viral metagenome TaxID=1070528 RepID=A0A6H2A532_9ZZZZ